MVPATNYHELSEAPSKTTHAEYLTVMELESDKPPRAQSSCGQGCFFLEAPAFSGFQRLLHSLAHGPFLIYKASDELVKSC